MAEKTRGLLERLRHCKWCQKEFSPRAWQISAGLGLFCSHDCASKDMQAARDQIEVGKKRLATYIQRLKEGKIKPLSGEDHPLWKGGITKNLGYWRGSADGRGYLHRVMMERYLGRKLTRNEVVHHVNHDKLDNRIENLEVMSRAEHVNHHRAHRKVA